MKLLIKYSRNWFAAVMCGASLSGCATVLSHQIREDHRQLRDVVMQYVDDQIMDNLIRAAHGLPIAHLDFSHVNASASLKVASEASGGRTSSRAVNRAPNRQTSTSTTTAAAGVTTVVTDTVAAIGGAVQTVTKPFAIGGGVDNTGTLSVEVNPVLNSPGVYRAYVEFLNGGSGESTQTVDASDQQLPEIKFGDVDDIPTLKRGVTAPNTAVLTKKWRDGLHYWIPAEHKNAFFKLCLATVMRANPQASDKAARDIESTLRQQFLSQ